MRVNADRWDSDEGTMKVEGESLFQESTPVPKASSTYIIVLDKSRGSGLGLDVDHTVTSGGIPIRAITGGLAAQWNAANPTESITVGDEILEVNGSSGDVNQLLERCKRDALLRMVVKRSGADGGSTE